MNKQLEALMERAAAWPEPAQEEAVRALAAIEEKHLGGDLAAARDRIERSLADPRPDVPLDEAFERVERVHAKRMKARGDAA
jgi:hypothetical protein